MNTYEVKFAEENEYCGDLVHHVTVNSETWDASFNAAKEAFFETNPEANRLYNFDSKKLWKHQKISLAILEINTLFGMATMIQIILLLFTV